jgi:N-acetylmuramoyl-L-alanine amidase
MDFSLIKFDRLVLSGLILLLIAVPVTASANTLNLVGQEGSLSHELPAWHANETWHVDLHEFFQALDFSVSWQAESDRLDASKDGTEMRFRPGTDRVLVDGRTLSMISSPTTHDGRLYLPASAVANLLNRHTDRSMIWNPARRQLQVASSSAWAQEGEGDPIGTFIEDIPEKEEDEMRVMIDPGHGGRDPGAIGYNGIREKRVVLEISRRIKRYLQKNYDDVEPILTRSGDEFIPLSRRTQMANDKKADVFLSIHANANRSSRARGFEVYTLSGEATSPSAKELAEIENSSLRYEGMDASELDDISFILHQLTQTVNARQSQSVARTIMERAESILPIPTRRARQAPFWVLKDARMPAVLVETGFLSNPDEEEILQTDSYQTAVAEVIGKAMKAYMSEQFQ